MRAMILAAGLGTRLRPLSELRAKPALPVRGRPVIAYLLELLAHHGVREVVVNLHHRPETVVAAIEEFGPRGVAVTYSREERPLGTGGGIRRVREFLAASDPSLVLAGDMLLDVDLTALAARHRRASADCTLLLRRDPRAAHFGTIGVDSGLGVTRIGSRFDLGGETAAGVFTGVRVFSPSALEQLPAGPEDAPFEDLSDWLAPALARRSLRVLGDFVGPEDSRWEPVGTPSEYLSVNLDPPPLAYLPASEILPEGTKVVGRSADVVLGRGAELGRGSELARCVIWDHERVPEGIRARGGVFAAGRFYACEEDGVAPEGKG